MKVYFTIHSLPELQGFSKRDQRFLYRKLCKNRNFWMSMVVVIPLLIGLDPAIQAVKDANIPLWKELFIFLTIVAPLAYVLEMIQLNLPRGHIKNKLTLLSMKGAIKTTENDAPDGCNLMVVSEKWDW